MNVVTLGTIASFLISIAAVLVSGYSVSLAKKRGDNTDIKAATASLTEVQTEIRIIKDAVLGTPTLSAQVLVNNAKINEHDRRLSALEGRV